MRIENRKIANCIFFLFMAKLTAINIFLFFLHEITPQQIIIIHIQIQCIYRDQKIKQNITYHKYNVFVNTPTYDNY